MSNPIPLSANSYCVNDIIYKPGDRVITKVNGAEVEATVRRVTVDIEVKTADGNTWWRALSRLRPSDGGVAAGAEPKGERLPVPVASPISSGPVEPHAEEPTREEIFAEAAEAPKTQGEERTAPSANLEPETTATDKSKRRSHKRKR